jgi:hypothetical protein
MEKFLKAVKFISVGLVVAGLSACGTTSYKSVEPWQGKVWRGVIAKTLVDTTTHRPSKEMVDLTHFDYNHDIGLRLARVHFSSGWNSILVAAAVPDSIDFSDIPKGTLVDVVTVTGPDTDYSMGRITRIIRVVCQSSDEVCFAREKAANRYGAVIDDHPAHESYGLTFDKRETKADIQKYD